MIAAQRRPPLPSPGQAGGPAHDVEHARHRLGRGQGVQAVREHPPPGQARAERRGGHRFHGGGDVDRDDAAAADPGPHRLGGHVVERPAVDQQVAVGVDRREDAGQRQAGPDGPPQRPSLVDDLLGTGQVRGHAEEAHRQVLDRAVPQVLREQPVHPVARGERDEREGRADQAAAAGERAQRRLDPLCVRQPLRVQPAHHCADAGPADDVDRHARLLEGAQHAEVREAARAPAAEHHAAGGAGDHPGQPGDVAGVAVAQVVVVRHRPFRQPPGRACRAGAVDEHKLAAQQRAAQGARFHRPEPGIGAAARQQHEVTLAEAAAAPLGVFGIGLVDDVVVAALHRVEPPGQLVPARMAGIPLRRPGAEVPVGRRRVQPHGHARAGKLRCQRRRHPGRVRSAARAGRGHRDRVVARVRLRPVHGEQPLDEQPGHLAQQPRVPRHQRVERRVAQHEQVAVPHGAHRRRPGPVAEQRDLPDDRPPPEVMQDPVGPARRHRDAQPPADQDEQPVARLALGDYHVARGHADRFELARQPQQRGLVQRGEERDAREERAEFPRVIGAASLAHPGSIADAASDA